MTERTDTAELRRLLASYRRLRELAGVGYDCDRPATNAQVDADYAFEAYRRELVRAAPKLLDELDALRRENVRYVYYGGSDREAGLLNEQHRELERLRAALEPFAEAAKKMRQNTDDWGKSATAKRGEYFPDAVWEAAYVATFGKPRTP